MKYIFNIKILVLSAFLLMSFKPVNSIPPASGCWFTQLAKDITDPANINLKEFIYGTTNSPINGAERLLRIECFRIVTEAISVTSKFRLDDIVLGKIKNLAQANSNFRTKLGAVWRDELKTIIKKQGYLGCATCGQAAGNATFFSTMEEFLDEVDFFVHNYDVLTPGTKANQFYKWIKREGVNDVFNGLHEMHQLLYILKKRALISVTAIDGTFTIGNNKFDILYDAIYRELKNKKFASFPLASGGTDVTQLIEGYITNLTSLDKMEWIAHLKKLEADGWTSANALENMKKQMAAVFKTRYMDIYQANSSMFNGTWTIYNGTATINVTVSNITQFQNLVSNSNFFTSNMLDFVKVE